MSQFEVYTFLSQFGTIMNIENGYRGELWVVYHRSAAVDRLKAKSRLPIDGRKSMTIEWGYDGRWRLHSGWTAAKLKRTGTKQRRSLATAAAPPAQTDAGHMLNALNDDCIRSIVEASVSEAVGLVEVAKVCTRFRYIARQVFDAKYRSEPSFYRTLVSRQPLSLIAAFFRIFGASIKTLDFGQRYNGDTINGIVDQHCPQLECMQCELTQPQTRAALRRLAGRIKRMFVKCAGSTCLDLSDTFDASAPTELLSVCIGSRLVLPAATLARLTDVRIKDADLYNTAKLKAFFRHNGQLEHLRLRNIGISVGIEHIVQLLPNLRSISLCFRWPPMQCNDYECFGRLRQLRSVHVRLEAPQVRQIIDTLVKRGTQLEQLRFCIGQADVATQDAIGEIQSLQVLQVDCLRGGGSGGDDLLRFVQRVQSNLRQLKVTMVSSNAAMSLVRLASDRLAELAFVIAHERYKAVGLLDDKLAAIRCIAQQKDIRLTVVMLYEFSETEIPVSECGAVALVVRPIYRQACNFASLFCVAFRYRCRSISGESIASGCPTHKSIDGAD